MRLIARSAVNKKHPMKNIPIYSMSLLLAFALAACHNHSKKQNETENNRPERAVTEYYKRMEGSMGDRRAVLQLAKYQSPVQDKGAVATDYYRGVLINGGGETPLDFVGKRISDSLIQLVTYDHYNPVDTFRGHFSQATFKGKVIDSAGQKLPFSFKEKYPAGSFHWDVAAYSDSLFYDPSKTEGPKAETRLMTLWPGTDVADSLRDLIADTLSQSWFGMQKTFDKPELLLQAVSDTFMKKYRQATDEWAKKGDGTIGPSFNWNTQAHVDMVYNAEGVTSLRFTQYQFTGGAHGLQSVFCLVVDMKKRRVLKLNDLFEKGYEQKLRQALEEELRKQYDIPGNAPLNGDKGILFDAHLPVSTNFYLTGNGIGFIYNPYEVAPYVVGQIDLYIPFNRISGLLRK